MTTADLKSRTVRDLASMAKRKKVPGWHSMKKKELVDALLHHARHGDELIERERPQQAVGFPLRASRCLEQIKTKLAEAKDLTFRSVANGNELCQGPLGRHGPRSLLVACLLGTEPEER